MRQQFGASHTGKKLDVLDKYHGVFPFLMRGRYKSIYIDAFAGSGEVLLAARDAALPLLPDIDPLQSEVLEGSAPRALRAAVPYDRYVFIEKKRKNLDGLKIQVARDFPSLFDRCRFECADANAALKKICAETDWDKHRAVVFLDPFGNHVDWETLEIIARTRAADVWYLAPTGLGIWRQIPKKGKMQEASAQSITRILGDDSWRHLFTKQETSRNLFDEAEINILRDGTVDEVTRHVIQRLRTIFRGGVLDQYVLLGGSDEMKYYSLVFAVSNPRTKAKELAHRVAGWIVSHTYA